MGYVLMFAMPIIVLIYGFIGIIKDRKLAMAIIGLNLGLAYFVLMVFGIFINVVWSPYHYL
ncbi:MAG: hypothetical protein ACFE96_16070 [Candidatus Hermodarchaeota archaeon]